MPDQPARPFQFTLRSLFVLTTLTAIFSSAYFTGPGWLRLLCLAFVLTASPVVLTVAMIHGRGYLRTFCIGGLFPVCLTAFWASYMICEYGEPDPGDTVGFLLTVLVVPNVLGLAGGALAMAVRWIVEGPQSPPETASPSADVATANTHPHPLDGPHFHCAACGQVPTDGRLLCPTCHETEPGS